jgi:hypothetical protein
VFNPNFDALMLLLPNFMPKALPAEGGVTGLPFPFNSVVESGPGLFLISGTGQPL